MSDALQQLQGTLAFLQRDYDLLGEQIDVIEAVLADMGVSPSAQAPRRERAKKEAPAEGKRRGAVWTEDMKRAQAERIRAALAKKRGNEAPAATPPKAEPAPAKRSPKAAPAPTAPKAEPAKRSPKAAPAPRTTSRGGFPGRG